MTKRSARWNHNIHYHPLILAAVPIECDHALDVGCGEGTLARELKQVIRYVTALDRDQASVRLAKEQDQTGGIEYLTGDFLTYPFEESFDFVASVASLHHMDARHAFCGCASSCAPEAPWSSSGWLVASTSRTGPTLRPAPSFVWLTG